MKFHHSFILAFTTSGIASVLTQPLDLAKVRMQVQRVELSGGDSSDLSKGRFGYRNVFHGIGKIVAEEGFLALFRGMSARLIYLSLVAGFNISMIESFRNLARSMMSEH
jgi:hypothetical protein